MPQSDPFRTTIASWDWPTIGLLLGVVVLWGISLWVPTGWAVLILIPTLALHSSLSHELLHGHPFGAERVETGIGLWQPGLFIPYLRFKRTHLAHHQDANLTDPYDDPETNYLDPAVWAGLGRFRQTVLQMNGTLAGRIVLGPFIGTWAFIRKDWAAVRAGDRQIALDWLAHVPGTVLTLWVVWLSPLPVWAYLLACYAALSLLKVRTFLEHRAHTHTAARTVIIEDRGPLAFLFLNNNLHVVHHMYPTVPWYDLGALYQSQKERFAARNDGYTYRSYAQIFRLYFWRRKDEVAHPLWQAPRE
jgi:fatty acid desaturase